MTKYQIGNDLKIYAHTTDKNFKCPECANVGYYDLNNTDKLESDSKWGILQSDDLQTLLDVLPKFKMVAKEDATPSIRNGAWAVEVNLITLFAEKIGGSAIDSCIDMFVNILAEEDKFMNNQQWAIDDLITTPLKAIFDNIPKLQRKVMRKTLVDLTAKTAINKLKDQSSETTPLYEISQFLEKEYALD